MQFTAVFAFLAALAVTQVSANVQCTKFDAPPGSIDQGGLQNCLNNYRNNNWDGMNCGGRGWFKGHHKYKSPNDCYDACSGCILESIQAGASQVECDDFEGGTKCWMGYH
ncbi:hypothetical protein BC628DRAFT_1416653 [Trametes gibbosa]|nr:hypothetical protein BC628DRAFT_1331226 [Trametes gibbosa]KAI0830380.1 hypothetical protein BC628DRAFT_1416653 [Trametes gibbosa]